MWAVSLSNHHLHHSTPFHLSYSITALVVLNACPSPFCKALCLGGTILIERTYSYWKNVFYFTWSGAYEQEHATPLCFCHGVFINWFTFGSNLLWMRLAWESHNQSKDTNWRHCVTGPELPFFHKRKGVLKIDQSVKMPWHRLSMGVASSCSSAPDLILFHVHLSVFVLQLTFFWLVLFSSTRETLELGWVMYIIRHWIYLVSIGFRKRN